VSCRRATVAEDVRFGPGPGSTRGDLSPDGLFSALIVGAVGLGLFMYGKRQERYPQLIGGMALMVYPYFVAGSSRVLTIGALIVGAIVLAVQAGY
jgi:multisubunit Na+/H+ antiporter MnhB subunit